MVVSWFTSVNCLTVGAGAMEAGEEQDSLPWWQVPARFAGL